jgi:hypothetical protein
MGHYLGELEALSRILLTLTIVAGKILIGKPEEKTYLDLGIYAVITLK